MEVRKNTTEAVSGKKRKRIRWLGLLVQIETPLKAINTSASVYQLLLTGEERMALGTNVNYDVLLGGASLDDVAASTTNGRLFVVGMDSLLHAVSPLSG